ncbi:MAG TPA: hypothetical protein P5137_11415, partial [Candidatus Brocadiia bacterium]|nr:hypothetical protein [Candidatus Brocadiia bacterium]
MEGEQTRALREKSEKERDDLFAKIAVEMGLATPQQIDEARRALEACQREGISRKLATILREKGVISR